MFIIQNNQGQIYAKNKMSCQQCPPSQPDPISQRIIKWMVDWNMDNEYLEFTLLQSQESLYVKLIMLLKLEF